jgi:hypothetical protein
MDIFEDALKSTPPVLPVIVVDDVVNDDGSQPSKEVLVPSLVGSKAKSSKRASPLGKLPKITAAPEPADGVVCVYVGMKKKRKPVPMWPQYTVEWNGSDFAGRFIVVSSGEIWLVSLVKTVTRHGSGAQSRKVAKASMERVRREWEVYLQQARKPKEQDEDKRTVFRRKSNLCGEVLVEIGGHNVYCLNDARKMVMRADSATMKFIEEWMVPIIVHQGRAIDESWAESPEDGASIAGFQFVGNPTPNIRDKVAWHPASHRWNLHLKNPKSAAKPTFIVDGSLRTQEYEAKKIELYSEAISTWNELDGSTRHRIPVSTLST